MKAGREYENFIFEAFKRFFPKFHVVINDKIRGVQSGILREIDVSLRGQVAGTEILYVIQAKDYTRPADINIIGTFSAAIKDVGASKGFLICSAGFAKTVRDYAKSLGIELLSVEDINSDRWTAIIEIPVALIVYQIIYNLQYSVIGTEELAKSISNKGSPMSMGDILFSFDGGRTFAQQGEQIQCLFANLKLDLRDSHHIQIPDDEVRVKILNCLVPASETELHLSPVSKRYLKFVKPEEYLVIKDHLRGVEIPITFRVENLSLKIDESWQAVPENELPVRPAGISMEFEIRPQTLGEIDSSSSYMTIVPI